MLRALDTPGREGSVLLLSGGIESATLLHLLARDQVVHPLFIDYGQRAADQERVAARAQCKALGLGLGELDMAAVGHGFRADRERKLHVPLPHRNLVIASLAISYATHRHAAAVALALNREDTGAYASATTAFIEHLRVLARDLDEIHLLTPLITLSKPEVIAQGLEIGVDYRHSYSCLLGYAQQCGACPQCEKRRGAFAALGMADPAGFKRPGAPGYDAGWSA